ncbi:CPBP family glutamic-type intramembrane protease [Marinisporobacter balticus]|uniref:CAAX prenyl protease 2/Lysostaphin resistance protein A-like domain-containing protein n=1 Tax=Marinisporobacter balticus TaxID=2018667 RepID=A0A4R2KQG6_9FIRM|nr:CPBP family glutamic-type intramembrane protease [Marinisporobacter balticus]TCO76511.1 hypothetical protein EV214_108114 [Marinisporobacter balticus]
MKIDDYINNETDKSKFIIIAVILSFVCIIILSIIGAILNFFGMTLLGQFLSSITLLILFILVGKIFFNINYSELFKEIKLSKYDSMDNLFVTIFFSSVSGFIVVLIYQIDFMINPNRTKLIRYLIKSLNYDNYSMNSILDILMHIITLDIFIHIIIVAIAVVVEEIFFRYNFYKIFVEKKKDVKIFIILSSIIFGIYHCSSISRFFASLVLSISISIIYVMTKNIVYAFVSHFLWDLFTFVSPGFIGYFNNINMSIDVFVCGFIEIIMICLLILLSIYSYYKRGYILSLKTRNKIYSIINDRNIY